MFLDIEKADEIEVLDMFGISLSKMARSEQGPAIDLTDFPEGIYYLKISAEDRWIVNKVIRI